ncbi:MAG: hypothetical protein ACFFDD_11565 [Promethearchaeota archaeon]
MEDRMDCKIVGLAIVFLLCWMGYFPLLCEGDLVWSDDFNDGNYDGWTICENPNIISGSNWSVANNDLQLDQTTWCDFWEINWGLISYPSDIAYGTWSFDFKANESLIVSEQDTTVPENIVQSFSIVFISNDIDNLDDINDWKCYWIHFKAEPGGNSFVIYLRKNLMTVIDRAGTLVPVAGWHHINVTRDTAGYFEVYHNDILIMQGMDTEIDTSELFVCCAQNGAMFDNIVVDDEILIDPQPYIAPMTMILLVGGGIAAIIVIVLVVWKVRRRT